MFEDSVDRLLRDLVTPEGVIAAEGGPMPDGLWAAIEANGLALAAAPESAGGIGAPWQDCCAIARLAGFHAAPVPLAETLAVNWLLGLAGAQVVAGAASLGLSRDGKLADGGFTGSVAGLPWAGAVEQVLVGCGDVSILLPVEAAKVEPERNVAGEPRDTLHFTNTTPIRTIDGNAVLIAGAMVRTAQIAGALARLRNLCADYAQQRVQFGRPIAKFQAVQHSIARLAEQAALASAAAGAAFSCDDPKQGAFIAAAAKQVASEAAGEGASLAHAIVGAIGFTQEYVLHLLTRRLWAWRAEFGSARYWADVIGAAACAQPPARYWPMLVEGGFALAKDTA